MQPKALKEKIDKIDEMLAKLQDAVQDGNPVLDLPSANGLIAECQSDGLKIVEAIFKECQEKGIPVWIDGRSLLASCRTQHLLPWETALEIGMFEDGWDAVKTDILAELDCILEGCSVKPRKKPKYGRICPEVKVHVWVRDAKTVHMDNEGSTAWSTEDCILPLKERSLNGMAFASPSNAWSILEAEYGSGWKKMV